MSDLHLGHKNICKYREGFQSAEEHHETLFQNLTSNITKRDTIWFLGDVAFTHEWLQRIAGIRCHKVLIAGNHDLENGIRMTDLVGVYNDVKSLVSHKGFWFSHCPIHPDEIRKRKANIHGHTHNYVLPDPRYVNVCVEHTNFKPIDFELIKERYN